MNPLFLLVGGLSLLIFLMFMAFVGILWSLKQLYAIASQNDAIIAFLYNISSYQWLEASQGHEAHASTGLAEDMEEFEPQPERKLRLHRQEEVYELPEPHLAGLK